MRFAKCCVPVPGDPIVAFVTYGRGVTIHTETCRNLQRILAGEATASALSCSRYMGRRQYPLRRVGIRIDCRDRKGLLRDVSEAITGANVLIHGSNTKTVGEKALLRFIVEIKNREQLYQLYSNVRAVKGVLRVTRDAGGFAGEPESNWMLFLGCGGSTTQRGHNDKFRITILPHEDGRSSVRNPPRGFMSLPWASLLVGPAQHAAAMRRFP